MLPDSPVRISSRVGSRFSASRYSAEIRKPGVQKPHCSPWQSANACCSGCSSPLSAAVPPGELGEAPPARGRELHRLDELVVLQAGLQRAGEQARGRYLAPACRPRDRRDPAGCDRDDGEFGGRIGVRQAAAERAAGADGGVAHPAGVLDAAGPDVVEGCWLHRYRPWNLGERLSVRARRPSAASSLAQQASKSLASPALSGSLRAFLA
jgi:hypothetical protein